MIISISRSGIVRLKKKKVKPVLKHDEPINTNEQELADNSQRQIHLEYVTKF